MSSTNLKKGLTCSAFDLFHAGHVAMLEEAKKQCDYLIAALQTNPQIDRPEKNAPLQSVVERYIQLSGCKYIDEIIPYETEEDLLDLMQLLDFNVRIIGDEYREKDYTGKQYCLDNGIEIYYNSRHHRFASSQLRNKMKVSDD